MSKVIVGMSGGVDSSVSALLLKQQGHDVQGLFMKNWEEDDDAEYCSAAEDLRDAKAVCERLDIPLHTVNFASEYWDNVFEHFLAEYQAGRTPNPDVLCNREIKFKVFLEYAQHLGAECIATGHYVRKGQAADGSYQLLTGLDNNKDQSYFLYMLNQAQLAPSLFPVGELEKPAVRALAEEYGLITHAKKDSTGICFIGERRFKDFLARFLAAQPGDMITPDGEIIGTHDGLMYYTLGQRQGLKIGGRQESSGEPWYVVDKDVPNNQLIVAQGHQHPRLFKPSLVAQDLHWVAGQPPADEFQCHAKIRYRQAAQPCSIKVVEQTLQVSFTEPQCAVTPGQSVVFYQDNVCLGGGIIR